MGVFSYFAYRVYRNFTTLTIDLNLDYYLFITKNCKRSIGHHLLVEIRYFTISYYIVIRNSHRFLIMPSCRFVFFRFSFDMVVLRILTKAFL